MLGNQQSQENYLVNIAAKTSGNYNQIETLFAAQAQLQSCITSNQNLFETNFGQEQTIRVDAAAWLELRNNLVSIEKDLHIALKNAQAMLNSSVQNFNANNAKEDLKTWNMNAKRFILLDLLNTHNINPELINAIDESFLEEPESMLAFTSPSTPADLLVLLEEQIKDFSTLVKKAELAITPQDQEDILHQLLGDASNTEDLLFDVFASGFSAMGDFEISFVVIATYMVLCS